MSEQPVAPPIVGQALYMAIGTGESSPFMVEFVVEAIELSQDKGAIARIGPNPDDPKAPPCSCLSFPLSSWPDGCRMWATKRQAWQRCHLNILRDLSDSIRHREEAIMEHDHEMATEWAKDIARLSKHAEIAQKRAAGETP